MYRRLITPADIPLGLYVHIPWCIRKCPYCDFNSHQADTSELPEADYLKALIDDIDQELLDYRNSDKSPELSRRSIETIFIGGGTPSLMSPDFYQQLFAALRKILVIRPNAEITLEANPGSLHENNDLAKLTGFRRAGINRLSIGVQSFNDAALESLGRVHGSMQAKNAFHVARQAGFDNINLDLMYGLSSQTIDAALADLQAGIALSPEHISWYQLTIEPNTVFYSQPPELPEEDCLFDMAEQGQALLEEAGYQRYEISAYAKPGRQAQHNLNYWRFGDYIGIGAGAHGKISTGERIIRRSKTRMPRDYINNKNRMASEIDVLEEDLPLEFMMNALRLVDGFQSNLFAERTGLPVAEIGERLDRLVEKKLITLQKQGVMPDVTVKPTARGMQLHNELVGSFMPDQARF